MDTGQAENRWNVERAFQEITLWKRNWKWGNPGAGSRGKGNGYRTDQLKNKETEK